MDTWKITEFARRFFASEVKPSRTNCIYVCVYIYMYTYIIWGHPSVKRLSVSCIFISHLFYPWGESKQTRNSRVIPGIIQLGYRQELKINGNSFQMTPVYFLPWGLSPFECVC